VRTVPLGGRLLTIDLHCQAVETGGTHLIGHRSVAGRGRDCIAGLEDLAQNAASHAIGATPVLVAQHGAYPVVRHPRGKASRYVQQIIVR
jgi:hypothetical protein